MTKVFFDHQKFTTQRYGGISRYFGTLIQEIKENKDFDYLLGVLGSDNYYIKDEAMLLNNLIGKKLINSALGRKIYAANEAYCKYLLKRNDFDVFHPTYYDPYFLGKLKKPFVTTIHDMTYERLPQYFWANDPLTLQKRLSVEHADHIIAISKTTKSDLLQYTDVKAEQISVIYHGIDIDTEPVFSTVDIPENYLLYVGDRSGYKNFHFFAGAFAEVNKRHPDLKLILTGGGPMGVADIEFLKRLKIESAVTHIQVTDEELNFLYRNAMIFVYPSLYEGFGLPILESFKCGCPVLLSDTECFREIASNAAMYFNPSEVDDLIHKLEVLVQGESLRASYKKLGYDRVKYFPINDCIEKTLQLYKLLA